jgi:L-fuconolactonase
MQRIDAHQHLWRYSPEEYGWIDESLLPLRRDFLLDDLRRELAAAGVGGSVAVQARQTVEETDWLLHLADNSAGIGRPSPLLGVVGWLPLAEPEFPALLEKYVRQPRLKGLRHVVQAEPAGFLDGAAFNVGIRALRGTGLVYDLLISRHQLAECTRFVDRHPHQIFVLDHLAKPAIAARATEPWRAEITDLARRPHVFCKVSGLVTEADPSSWADVGAMSKQLRSYFEVALEAFGPKRLMVGTDWPVLTVGCGYAQWWSTVEAWLAALNDEEQAAILGETAAQVYHLDRP